MLDENNIVVASVNIIIWAVIFFYLFALDKKTNKILNKYLSKDDEN